VSSDGSGHSTWDLPTRLFHWLLVVGVALAWLSHNQDWIEVHRWNGYTMLVLVVFSIVWGFVGSVHSRFADFVRSPAAVARYWRGAAADTPGHNPAGGWSVLALLALLLVQAVTGLFNSDGLLFDGPLRHALDSSTTDLLSEIHDQIYWVILGFVGLHVAAIAWYQWVRGERLLQPMLDGGSSGEKAPAPLWRAALVLALCAGALALVIYFAPEPEVTAWY
jgi:cytochrome b